MVMTSSVMIGLFLMAFSRNYLKGSLWAQPMWRKEVARNCIEPKYFRIFWFLIRGQKYAMLCVCSYLLLSVLAYAFSNTYWVLSSLCKHIVNVRSVVKRAFRSGKEFPSILSSKINLPVILGIKLAFKNIMILRFFLLLLATCLCSCSFIPDLSVSKHRTIRHPTIEGMARSIEATEIPHVNWEQFKDLDNISEACASYEEKLQLLCQSDFIAYTKSHRTCSNQEITDYRSCFIHIQALYIRYKSSKLQETGSLPGKNEYPGHCISESRRVRYCREWVIHPVRVASSRLAAIRGVNVYYVAL